MVRVHGVEEPAAKLGHDIPAGPGRAGQAGGDLIDVGVQYLRAGHDTAGRDAGSSNALTAAENSRQVPRSAASMPRPAGVSW